MPVILVPPTAAAPASLDHPGFARAHALPDHHEVDGASRLAIEGDAELALVVVDALMPDDGTAALAWYPLAPLVAPQERAIAVAAIEHAFTTWPLHGVWCEVVDESLVALLLDLGFRLEGRFRRHVARDGARLDVLRLALARKDWTTRRPEALRVLEDPDAPRGAYEPGAQHEVRFALSADDLRAFAALTGDANPIHLDDDAARALGFDGRIAHGMLAAAVFSRVFGTEFPGEGTIYVRQDLRFLSPVFPDRPLVATVAVTRRVGRWVTLRTTVREEATGTLAIDGEAELVVPKA